MTASGIAFLGWIGSKIAKKTFFKDLFENDFRAAVEEYKKHFKKFSFSKNIQELIIEMIFQMGIQKILNFKKTLKHIKKKNKFLASLEMMNSLWYKQTPQRAKNLIKYYLK